MKNITRTILYILSAIVATFALSACSGCSEEPETAAPASIQKAPAESIAVEDINKENMEEALDQLEKEVNASEAP